MTRPLLVVDGDSFAHRAYHALPKSGFRVELFDAAGREGFKHRWDLHDVG